MLTSPLIEYSCSPQHHYYQDMQTLVGAGVKNVNQSTDKIFFFSTVPFILSGYVDIGRAE